MIEKELFSSWKFWLIRQKYFFDSGNAIMSYPTKVMLLFGIGSAASNAIEQIYFYIFLGILYGVLLYVCGWIFITYGFLMCEQEVRNRNDAFVKEMRKKIIRIQSDKS